MTALIPTSNTKSARPVSLHGDAMRAVVTGVGIVSPVGDSMNALASAAEQGRMAFGRISRFDTSWCQTKIGAQISEEEDAPWRAGWKTAWMDRSAWYALTAIDLSLTDAQVELSDLRRDRISVVVGTCHAGFVAQETLFERHTRGRLADTGAREILPMLSSHVAAVIAARLGARGLRRIVTTACASSTGALGVASDLIRRGEADLVVTGGVDTLSLSLFAGFNSLGALAPGGCTPFCGLPGITLGEGAALFTLERFDIAKERNARVRAEVLGYALNGDAYHATAPDENGDGIERVMRGALGDANTSPGDIDYVSAHGTGTEANDRAESAATARVFGHYTPISAPKSILGHTIGACGAFEIALTLALAERGRLVPTLGFTSARQECEALDFVPNVARQGRVETVLCNNYGFGGANASVVLRRGVSPALYHTTSLRARVVLSGFNMLTPRRQIQSGTSSDCGEARKIVDPELPAALKRAFGRASPMIKYGIAVAGRALEKSGLIADRANEIGLVMGAITGAQRATEKFMDSIYRDGPGQASAQHFAYSANNAATGQIAIAYDLKGYNCTLMGAAGALGYAISLVEDRRQKQVVVAAADELTPLLDEVYVLAGVATSGPEAVCEGAAAFVLEQEEEAHARGAAPLARILGFGEFQDATFTGFKRNGDALGRAIAQALAQAKLEASDIKRAFSSGAPTARHAQAEGAALRRIFGDCLPEVIAPDRMGGGGASFAPLAVIIAAVEIGDPEPALVFGIDLSGVCFAAVVQSALGEGDA